MNNKIKTILISIILLILICIIVLFVIKNVNNEKDIINELDNLENIGDVEDANNVPTIDAKLGNDIRITQSYLLNYIIKKVGIWYMSSGYVSNIDKKGSDSIIQISSDRDNTKYLTTIINSSKCNVKKGDLVYFVGTINLDKWYINLTKVSTSEIDYSNVTKIDLNELIDNLNLLKSNYFIVSGYLVYDNNSYKLYDSKNVKDDSKNYFLLNFKDDVNLTENQNSKVKCLIENTYILSDCELQ